MWLNRLHETYALDIYTVAVSENMLCPYVEDGISAGFPSPANDHIDIAIDLNQELIKHPSATFFGRVKGDSMQDLGISDGDLLVIDKSLKPVNNHIVVCFIDGEFVMKTIRFAEDCCWLIPANDKYQPIRVTADNDFEVWGVVIHVIKSF